MSEIPRAKLFADGMPSGQYAVLHPVASQPDKTWPADRFLAVAAICREIWASNPFHRRRD